jgi:hypothetical protein
MNQEEVRNVQSAAVSDGVKQFIKRLAVNAVVSAGRKKGHGMWESEIEGVE